MQFSITRFLNLSQLIYFLNLIFIVFDSLFAQYILPTGRSMNKVAIAATNYYLTIVAVQEENLFYDVTMFALWLTAVMMVGRAVGCIFGAVLRVGVPGCGNLS